MILGNWNFHRVRLSSIALVFLFFFLIFDFAFPSNIWVASDYAYLILSNGLNLSARLSDFTFYPAFSMMYHPGVPFYFASWLSFLVSGQQFAGSDAGFLANTFDNANSIFAAARVIASAITALSILFYLNLATKVVPTTAALVGLIAWIAATPYSLLSAVFLSNETFALLANILLLWCAVCFSRGKVHAVHYVAFGAIAAFGYLIKLHYIYIYLSLLVGIVHYCTFSVRSFRAILSALLIYNVTVAGVIYLVGRGIIGDAPFEWLLGFHWHIFLQPGLYGAGETEAAASPDIFLAVIQSIRDLNLGILIGLVAGGSLAASAIILGLRKRIDARTATFSMMLGTAASVAGLAVLKHYVGHYAAAVSATIPGLLIGWWYLCKNLASRHPETYFGHLINRAFNMRTATGVVATAALLLAVMTCQTATALMALSTAISREAELDEKTIAKSVNTEVDYGIYRYRVPMRAYAAGFIISYASVPRLTQAYRAETAFSAYQNVPGKVRRNPGYVVVDKRSFPTRDTVEALPYQPIDEIRELRTVWLVLRHLPIDPKLLFANEWQRRLVQGERVLIDLSTSACGTVPPPLACGSKYSYEAVEHGETWCEKVRKTGSNEALSERCTSDPEKSVITLAGAPFTFNDLGEIFFDSRHVGQLEEIPPPNEWQTRLMHGDKIRVALSDSVCGLVPLPLKCGARYSLKLTKKDGRWCETIHQVGSDTDIGGRCSAIPDDSIIGLVGAPFSFNEQGEIFFDNHHVGQLEEIPPPNEWQTRLTHGEKIRVTLSGSGCGTVPLPLMCGARYSLKLTKKDGRWCETIHQVGSATDFGDRCSSIPDDSVIGLVGAPFSFNDLGEIFYDHHHVGQLEEIPPPNEWQRRLTHGEKIRVTLSGSGCGTVPLPLMCGARYSLKLTNKEGHWCETIHQVGSATDFGDRCSSIPDDSVIGLVGAPFSFNEQGQIFYDHHHVGQLEEIPPPNEWQARLMHGEKIRVALSDSVCGIVPLPLMCGARYSLKLTRKDGRWCETIHQVGSATDIGGRCSSIPDDSIVSLVGAPFSFNEQGQIFFDNRHVGQLEEIPPPNEWQSRFMRGERISIAFSNDGCNIIPAGLSCTEGYVVTLTEMDGRWCETSHQVGSDTASGMRCTADPEESIFTVVGAPFSFTTNGDVLYDRHLVGHLEVLSPPNE